MSRFRKLLSSIILICFLSNTMAFAGGNQLYHNKKNYFYSEINKSDSLQVLQLTGILAYDMKILSQVQPVPAADFLDSCLSGENICVASVGIAAAVLTFGILLATDTDMNKSVLLSLFSGLVFSIVACCTIAG